MSVLRMEVTGSPRLECYFLHGLSVLRDTNISPRNRQKRYLPETVLPEQAVFQRRGKGVYLLPMYARIHVRVV